MSRNRSPGTYGKLRVVENREASVIWRARLKEPEPCEPHGFSWMQTTTTDFEERELARIAFKAVDELARSRAQVIQLRLRGLTMAEVGLVLGVGKERVRQIEQQALRRLREKMRERGIDGSEYGYGWRPGHFHRRLHRSPFD
jgi:RNA polymerase sigma factor (sigma-70 family)